MRDPNKVLRLVTAAFLTGAWIVSPLHAAPADPAKHYPNKPVRFIVWNVPGSSMDITARAIAQKLSEAWGRQVIVDNRTGAAGVIAVDLTAKAVPDGYTICMISAAQTINSAVNPKLPYDLTQDLAAISQASSFFYVLYHHPSVPVKSVKELIAHANANPGKLNYGTAGAGSLLHFAGEMFNHMTGVKLIHVPYKGGPAAIAAMLAGDVQVGFGPLSALRPHMASGRLRLLAITAKERSLTLPELPTVSEAGVPGYEVSQWIGVVTGAKVSPGIINTTVS